MLTLEKIQKGRYSEGAIVYDTNNYIFGVVVDGTTGDNNDPCSVVLEMLGGKLSFNCPPNRALIPTGKIFPIWDLLKELGEKENA